MRVRSKKSFESLTKLSNGQHFSKNKMCSTNQRCSTMIFDLRSTITCDFKVSRPWYKELHVLMGPVRTCHRSHHFATQCSHFVDRAGWQAKMAWVKFWIPWGNAHPPPLPIQYLQLAMLGNEYHYTVGFLDSEFAWVEVLNDHQTIHSGSGDYDSQSGWDLFTILSSAEYSWWSAWKTIIQCQAPS